MSTIGRCRQYEDPLRGDADEAKQVYSVSRLDTEHPDYVRRVRHLGAAIHGIRGTFINCSGEHQIPDAFVLCCTAMYLPEELGTTFGKHCVQIDDPWALLHRITGALGERHPVRQAFWGPITYGERAFADGEEVPGPMGFVKPIKYRDQREVRLLWVVDDDGPLQPEMVDLPGMQQVCKRVA